MIADLNAYKKWKTEEKMELISLIILPVLFDKLW